MHRLGDILARDVLFQQTPLRMSMRTQMRAPRCFVGNVASRYPRPILAELLRELGAHALERVSIIVQQHDACVVRQ